MKPRWKKIHADIPWLQAEYYDIDEDEEKIKAYGIDIEKMPTFIFLDKYNKELERVTGEVEEKVLRELIEKYKDL